MRRFRHLLEYSLFRTIAFFCGLFPYKWGHERFGRVVGAFTYSIASVHRPRSLANLRRVFPDHSPEALERLNRAVFRQIGHIIHEFMQMRKHDPKWFDRYVECDSASLEVFRKARARGKGVILNGGHLGGWDVALDAVPAILGCELNAIAAPIVNPFAHDYIYRDWGRRGLKAVYRDNMRSNILNVLKRNEVLMLISDQDAGSRGVFLPFFGETASFHRGAATFSWLSGAEVLFYTLLRLPEDRFRMEITSLGALDKHAGNQDGQILAFLERYRDVLEDYARRYPEQYFWLHNRWKTKPNAVVKVP